jgi:hypothetical protein
MLAGSRPRWTTAARTARTNGPAGATGLESPAKAASTVDGLRRRLRRQSPVECFQRYVVVDRPNVSMHAAQVPRDGVIDRFIVGLEFEVDIAAAQMK